MKLIYLIVTFIFLIIIFQYNNFSSVNVELFLNKKNIDLYKKQVNENLFVFYTKNLNNNFLDIKKYVKENSQKKNIFIKKMFSKIIELPQINYVYLFYYDPAQLLNIRSGKLTYSTEINLNPPKNTTIPFYLSSSLIENKNKLFNTFNEKYELDYVFMHEFIENYLLTKKILKTKDSLVRWFNDGICDFFANKFYSEIHPENTKIYVQQNFSDEFFTDEDIKKVDILEWSLGFYYMENDKYVLNTSKEIDSIFDSPRIKYIAAETFFMSLEKEFGIDLIFEIMKTLSLKENWRSEEILKLIETKIGKESLEKLIGKNYYSRIEKYRTRTFKNLANHYSENVRSLVVLSQDMKRNSAEGREFAFNLLLKNQKTHQ